MADVFWLSDDQWAVVGRFMPTNQPGARRADDRRVVSGILHTLRTGARWRDVPAAVWTGHHGLQSVQQVVTARLLARHAGRPGRGGLDRPDGSHRQHLH